MKIASWNVNSINVRLPQVLDWLVTHQIDVLALQETKVVDALFPVAAFKDIGYQVSFSGQKTYNGVALIAKAELMEVCCDNPHFEDPARRFLAATVHGIRVINLYVPNGQSLDSDKYVYKLAWLEGIRHYLRQALNDYKNVVVLGDFNIAPTDLDVHDPALWHDVVLVSPKERAAFESMLALGLVDALRAHAPSEAVYTWWDYRQGGFRRNHGLRIDHILLSEPLREASRAVVVDTVPRKSERPSDHAPLWVELLL